VELLEQHLAVDNSENYSIFSTLQIISKSSRFFLQKELPNPAPVFHASKAFSLFWLW
jgi:hypothetical protein